MFRSYRAFASKSYKIFIWILYPLAAVFCCILVQNGCFGLVKKPGYHFMVAESMLCNCIVCVESMGDYFMFSGIQSKYANHMDFFKSSKKGKVIFRGALVFDIIRRALMIVICSGINAAVGIFVFNYELMGTEGIAELLFNVLICYFVSMLAVFISRYGDMWWLNFGMGYAGSIVIVAITMLVSILDLSIWIGLGISLIASIVITIVAVKVAMKKVEDSYYDQRS